MGARTPSSLYLVDNQRDQLNPGEATQCLGESRYARWRALNIGHLRVRRSYQPWLPCGPLVDRGGHSRAATMTRGYVAGFAAPRTADGGRRTMEAWNAHTEFLE